MSNHTINNKTPVLLLESSVNHLAIARQLGRIGVSVYGIDNDKFGLLFFSKYCKRVSNYFDPNKENEFVTALIDFSKKHSYKPLLYSGEDHIEIIAKHRDILAEYYHFTVPNLKTVNKIINKKEYYYAAIEAGIPVPKTFFPDSKDDVIKNSQKIDYPCILKPILSKSGAFMYLFRKKVFLAYSTEGLLHYYDKLKKHGFEPMIQEIIQGPDSNVYQYCSYINMQKETIAEFTYKKLRQYPPNFGICSLGVSEEIKELYGLGKNLLNKIGAMGISNTEFKKDERDGVFKLVETNLRSFGTIALGTRCGIDLILASYLDLTEQKIPAFSKQRDKVKWVNMFTDLYSAIYYFCKGELTFKKWLLSLSGEKEFAVFSWDDILPFIGFLLNGIFIFIKKKK